MTASYAYDSVSLDAMKQWFSDAQKEVYVLGPFLPLVTAPKCRTVKKGEALVISVGIETFLGEKLAHHGERSVILYDFFLFF